MIKLLTFLSREFRFLRLVIWKLSGRYYAGLMQGNIDLNTTAFYDKWIRKTTYGD